MRIIANITCTWRSSWQITRIKMDNWIWWLREMSNCLLNQTQTISLSFFQTMSLAAILAVLLACRLIFLLSSTRCMSHCFFFFFLCEKICKRDREKKNKKTKRKLCALTFSLVSKQHNAYCIHIQRYKTIENDDDKKKKNPK